jgi:hypothetical protein
MLYSAGWWFISVVVVGLLINVASYYVVPIFDKQLEKYSSRRRENNIKKKAYIEEEISRMLADEAYFNWLAIHSKATLILSQTTVLMAVAFMGLIMAITQMDSLVIAWSVKSMTTLMGISLAFILLIVALKLLFDARETIYIIHEYFERKAIPPVQQLNTE